MSNVDVMGCVGGATAENRGPGPGPASKHTRPGNNTINEMSLMLRSVDLSVQIT